MLHIFDHILIISNSVYSFRALTTSHLWFGVSVDLAGEGDWHSLKDFVVFELLVKRRRHPLAGRVLIMLDIIVRLLYWRTLQTEFDLADEALLEAGDFVFLREKRREGLEKYSWRFVQLQP